jgi:replicative DNA helicase
MNPEAIPQDQEAEKAVLGLILYRADFIYEVMSILAPESFFNISHQNIYKAMLELTENEKPIDEIILGNQLKANGVLEKSGGYSYLAELTERAPGSANIVYYAKIIREHSLIRDVLKIAKDLSHEGLNPEKGIGDLLSEAESKLAAIANRSSDRGYTHINEVVNESYKDLARKSEMAGEITGLPTGLLNLDKLTAGLQPSDLIVIAARPSMGKTSLAMNIASYVAGRREIQGKVMIFSLEMSKEQLAMRMLASEAMVDSKKLRSGSLKPSDWDKLAASSDRVSQMEIYISDVTNVTPYELTGSIKQLSRELGGELSLVIIDYLQLMQGGKMNAFREQEIAEISRSLKSVAKELHIPVIALSQLNRAVESRTDKRPQLSDLRESGAIEQDADLILFIYRDEVYHEDSPDKGIAEIIIAKHRNGPTGRIQLAFIGKYTKFANLSHQSPPAF